MDQAQRPLPQPTRITQPYWDAAKDHRLVVQQCGCCKARQFYPREFCTACLSDSIEWIESAGRGTVYTYTINRRPSNAALSEKVPYVVAMIDLDEGVRMMANIVECSAEAIRLGARVRVCFEPVSPEITLPQFRLEA
jgi:uncharacterized protein